MAYFRFNDDSGSIASEYPYHELWDLLVEKTTRAGHVLTFDEARMDPKFIDPNNFAFFFGRRFSDWAKEAWRTVMIKQEENMRKKFTKEQIAEALRKFYEDNGRLPTQTEMNRKPDLPGYDAARRSLGNKANWLNQIYGDAHPSLEEVNHSPQETQAVTLSAADDSAKDEAPAQEVLPIEAGVLEPEKAEESLEPQPEVIVNASHCSSSDDGIANIELKITLPDRENPIILSLSF